MKYRTTLQVLDPFASLQYHCPFLVWNNFCKVKYTSKNLFRPLIRMTVVSTIPKSCVYSLSYHVHSITSYRYTYTLYCGFCFSAESGQFYFIMGVKRNFQHPCHKLDHNCQVTLLPEVQIKKNIIMQHKIWVLLL